MSVLSGIDVLIRRDYAPLKGKHVGLLTNPSGVTRELVRTIDLFRKADKSQFELTAIFTPEHGLAAVVGDGELVNSSVDPVSGAPIYSLYGETFAPTAEMLTNLDVIVCDIQDIGARYYTFVWTITHVLEAAGLADVPVIILDRPNPLGDAVDGAVLDRRYETLVGRAPIPIQHGLTVGGLMLAYNGLWNPNRAMLTVIPCEGYRRGMTWEETGLPFVSPSPAMPHISTARHYPGACLVEGTNLSEGRGTALPFEIVGAPFIDAEALAAHLNGLRLPRVRYRPHVFQPTASKFAGQVCQGIQAHITGEHYRPLLAWLHVIRAVRELYPTQFAWKPGTFDRLYGSDVGRLWIESGKALDELVSSWDAGLAAWREMRQGYLIYD